MEEAFASIDRYYDFKAHNPQWFANLDNIEQLEDLFVKVKPRFVLKKRDVQGRIIIVQRLSKKKCIFNKNITNYIVYS